MLHAVLTLLQLHKLMLSTVDSTASCAPSLMLPAQSRKACSSDTKLNSAASSCPASSLRLKA